MAKAQPGNRRAEILRAAEKLMSPKGLNGVTTRQTSKEVGRSEGALYVHFKGRLDLLLAMLEESLPDAQQSFRLLEGSTGRSSPQANLVMAITGLYKFHRRVVRLFAGLFAEPKLLAAYRGDLLLVVSCSPGRSGKCFDSDLWLFAIPRLRTHAAITAMGTLPYPRPITTIPDSLTCQPRARSASRS